MDAQEKAIVASKQAYTERYPGQVPPETPDVVPRHAFRFGFYAGLGALCAWIAVYVVIASVVWVLTFWGVSMGFGR